MENNPDSAQNANDPGAAFDRDPTDGIQATSHAPAYFRYYDFVMAAFVAILLLSNVIGAAKQSAVPMPFWPSDLWPVEDGNFIFGAGILFFPLGYVIGDILTEVYGYARARRVIWTGFAALIFMAFMSWAVVAMPPADDWGGQASYEAVFGQVPRIVVASIIAFWAGEFVNSYVMAKMKVWTKGKALWSRTIGSTVVGQGVDSMIFYPVAFLFLPDWPPERVLQIALSQWLLKVLWEAALTPVTYFVVNKLKKAEGVDLFDMDTDFSPFSTKKD